MLSPNPGISVKLEQLISVASLFPEDKCVMLTSISHLSKTSHQQMQMRGVPETCVTRIPKPNSFNKSAQVSFLAAAWCFFFYFILYFFSDRGAPVVVTVVCTLTRWRGLPVALLTGFSCCFLGQEGVWLG